MQDDDGLLKKLVMSVSKKEKLDAFIVHITTHPVSSRLMIAI